MFDKEKRSECGRRSEVGVRGFGRWGLGRLGRFGRLRGKRKGCEEV